MNDVDMDISLERLVNLPWHWQSDGKDELFYIPVRNGDDPKIQGSLVKVKTKSVMFGKDEYEYRLRLSYNYTNVVDVQKNNWHMRRLWTLLKRKLENELKQEELRAKQEFAAYLNSL